MHGKINDLLLDIISSFGLSFPDDFRDYIFGDEPDIEYLIKEYDFNEKSFQFYSFPFDCSFFLSLQLSANLI